MSEKKVDLAIKLFQEEAVSVGRAAELAGMDRESFMQELAEAGVPVVNHDPADLDDDLSAIVWSSIQFCM